MSTIPPQKLCLTTTLSNYTLFSKHAICTKYKTLWHDIPPKTTIAKKFKCTKMGYVENYKLHAQELKNTKKNFNHSPHQQN